MENNKRALRWRKFRYILAFAVIFLIYLLIVFIVHPSKKATLMLGGFAAFFQTVIAVSAIWGNEIRALFLGPKLELSLDRKEGQLTHFTNQQPVRYFHLKVHNKRPGAPATKTQVILNSIVRTNKEGKPEPLDINGRLPFPWKFRGLHSEPQIRFLDTYMYSVIGPDDYCDLASLTDDGKFELQVEQWQLVKGYVRIQSGQKTTVEAIAIAENAQSNLLTLDIFWDGIWPGETDGHVTEHIKIDVAKPLSKRKRKKG